MKLKSLVLGAAGLFAVTGAQAADLPPAPHPVDYVRICDAFGSGFFYIPGTDSCLRISGRIRTEVRGRFQDEDQPLRLTHWWGRHNGTDRPFLMRARGYWAWDHRTNTDIGLVRGYFRGFITTDSATLDAPTLDYAFIQIGGLTLGLTNPLVQPIYNGYTSEAEFSLAGFYGQDVLAQYLYAFGNGFSVGAVVIDQDATDLQSVGAGGVAPLGVYAGLGYSGNHSGPAFGGAIQYDGSFGSFNLAALGRHIRPVRNYSDDTAFGWGVAFSGEFGIPFGTNTKFGFNGGYADGLIEFLHDDLGAFFPDFTALNVNSATETTFGWYVGAGISTQVFDRTTFNVSGSYTDVNPHWAPDGAVWDAQANLVYALTDNVALTAEGVYRNIDLNQGVGTSDAFIAMLRAQLDF